MPFGFISILELKNCIFLENGIILELIKLWFIYYFKKKQLIFLHEINMNNRILKMTFSIYIDFKEYFSNKVNYDSSIDSKNAIDLSL